MAGNSILVINAAGAETRVALVENGTIHEYYLERKREKGIVGNIYKGRVVRVLPGMQAAFVDIGLEKAAFLYVGDVYGDPDFSEEFELTEGEHAQHVPEVPSEQEAEEQEVKALAGGEPAPDLAPPAGKEAFPVALASERAEEPAAAADAGAPAPVADVTAAAETPIPLTQVVEPGEGPAPAAAVPAAPGAPAEPAPASGQVVTRPEASPREARTDRERDRGRRDDRRRGRNGRPREE